MHQPVFEHASTCMPDRCTTCADTQSFRHLPMCKNWHKAIHFFMHFTFKLTLFLFPIPMQAKIFTQFFFLSPPAPWSLRGLNNNNPLLRGVATLGGRLARGKGRPLGFLIISCPHYFFHFSSFLLALFLCFFVLFKSWCSHALVFGKTFVREFLIFYSHTEWENND